MALRTRPGRPQAASTEPAVPQDRAARRRSSLILGLALAAYSVLALGYAVRTPLWQNPDEPAHFNYALYVARTGGLPELRPGDWDSELLKRLQNGRLSPTDAIDSIRYESWQPPLYYMLASPLLLIGPSDPPTQVLRLRLFGVLLGGLTLVVAYVTARRLLPEPALVPLTMAGIPMFTAVSASVSADPLANLLAALLLLAVVTTSRTAYLGVLLGLGMITKLALGIFVPLVAWRNWRALIIAGLVSLPWLVHQVTTYGWTDPLAIARHNAVVADQPRFPGLSGEYAMQFLTISFHSFWAQFGWMAIPAPDWLYWLFGVLVIAAVAGLLRRGSILREESWRIVLVTVVLAFVAFLGYNTAFTQFQGRYLFTALVPICLLLVRGWGIGAYGAAGVLVVLNAYALLRVLVPGFAPVS
jgi:hypothetical protein